MTLRFLDLGFARIKPERFQALVGTDGNAIEQSKAHPLGDLPTNRNTPQAKSG